MFTAMPLIEVSMRSSTTPVQVWPRALTVRAETSTLSTALSPVPSDTSVNFMTTSRSPSKMVWEVTTSVMR